MPRGRNRAFTPGQVEQLKHGYTRDGKSIRVLAKEAGRSYGAVHSALNRAGVALRPRGGVKGSTRPKREKVEEQA